MPTTPPFIRVLGTAQDGGFPHAGCPCARCAAARRDPALRRRVACIALVLSDRVLLVDATPDLPEQLELLGDLRGERARCPVDGLLLTHAHLGHYLGLAYFGPEAIASDRLPVHCTSRMASFLRENGPWRQLVTGGHIDLRPLTPGTPVELGDGVHVTAHAVPHRDEWSDTVAFLVRGPDTRVLYMPDTDPWDAWTTPVTALLDDIDVAILDGTFHTSDELGARDQTSVGHPPMVDTMDLLQDRVDRGLRVLFTHMNHTNPALDTGSAARREIERRGFDVLDDGVDITL
jgi:pyrroloquinoline quinone biosynthesis protein B